jgi:hypothetical protein
MPIALSSLRVMHRYRLINFGEKTDFEIIDMGENGRIRAKNLLSLEVFLLEELTRYGKGKDFDLRELNE